MKNKHLLFLDIETTGFDLGKHEIVEIGAVLVKQNWSSAVPTFELVKEFEVKVQPMRIQDADPTALRVNGYNEGEWIFAISLEQAMHQLAELGKDAIMVAHNIAFDAKFIEHAFETTGVNNALNFRKLDTISIAFAKLAKSPDVQRFSLNDLCEHFGVKNERAHTALADARATFELYQKLMTL
ncbi:MAG: 3'-5' exonuclease [Candidatus Nomurabacteria bacterium]|nr:3'-5' exonuclease [Candidatus Nomurabacteria bacterium]